MKRYLFVLIIIIFITGCSNEEPPQGDIYEFNMDINMVNYYEYNTFKYNMIIQSEYPGKPYNNTIFSFMIDNSIGMYLFNYLHITKGSINNYLYENDIVINNKEYRYYLDNNTLQIAYNIDNDYYLQLSIQSLNENNIDVSKLLNYFNFDIIVK